MTVSRSRSGVLVALEGIDGAGKSTLARSLAAALRRRGYSVRQRREPADRKLGRIAQDAGARDAWTGAIYFTVDRHLALPDLARDLHRFDVVLTDRSFYSTLAYQGSALSGRDQGRLLRIETSATLTPDVVVLLDLSPSTALVRLGRRSRLRGPLERQQTLARVAKAYRRLSRRGGWIVLDAIRPVREHVGVVLDRLRLPPPRRMRPRPRRR